MPRRKYKKVQRIPTDPLYNDPIIGSTINRILKRGKKSIAESMMYEALDIVAKKTGKPPRDVYAAAVRNISPAVQVKSRRVGGATYQVPIEISADRQQAIAISWLLDFARARSGSSFANRLAEEIIDASENRGGAIKKKLDTHKMAEANKAFSHYRF
ncbi:MAG: 30S ribosomal protein S7 [bacterium]